MKIHRIATTGSCALVFCLLFGGCQKNEPIDEAKAAEKTTADFPQITADIFKPMDGGIDLSRGNYGAQHLEPLERRQRAFLESRGAGQLRLDGPFEDAR